MPEVRPNRGPGGAPAAAGVREAGAGSTHRLEVAPQSPHLRVSAGQKQTPPRNEGGTQPRLCCSGQRRGTRPGPGSRGRALRLGRLWAQGSCQGCLQLREGSGQRGGVRPLTGSAPLPPPGTARPQDVLLETGVRPIGSAPYVAFEGPCTLLLSPTCLPGAAKASWPRVRCERLAGLGPVLSEAAGPGGGVGTGRALSSPPRPRALEAPPPPALCSLRWGTDHGPLRLSRHRKQAPQRGRPARSHRNTGPPGAQAARTLERRPLSRERRPVCRKMQESET